MRLFYIDSPNEPPFVLRDYTNPGDPSNVLPRAASGAVRHHGGMTSTIAPGEALQLRDLIAPTEHGIASRILAKTSGGSLTLFAFDAGQGLAEHSAPFEAMVLVMDGRLSLTIGDKTVSAAAGTVIRLPANVPHAVDAQEPSRMLLTMLREPKQ